MCQRLTLPETLLWYALPPAFARGLLHSIRHRLRDVLPVLVSMGGIVEKQRRREAAGVDRELGVSPGLAVAPTEPAAPRFIGDQEFVYPDETNPAKRS